jgi:hypothetical protein
LEDVEVERLIGGAPRLALQDIVSHPRLPDARKLMIYVAAIRQQAATERSPELEHPGAM